MKSEKILTVDIGGTHIKSTILSEKGEMLEEYVKTPTPESPSPEETIEIIAKLIANFSDYDKISVGFPGYVRDGIIFTAPNLGTKAWKNCAFAQMLANKFKKPVRLLNDADMQGFGLASGKGLEMVITLGTGFGTALFLDGMVLPHFELAHLPVRKGKDYDAYIGDVALSKDGEDKWNKKLKDVLKTFKTVINYDKLYLSGGNSKRINFKLDSDIEVTGNRAGIKGGALLWQKPDSAALKSIHPE